MYQKLKRVWSNGYMGHIPNFKETFPELKHLSSEELCDRWVKLNIEFYQVKSKAVPFWLRLTLPFAILTMITMFLMLPFLFLFTGKWGYSLGEKNTILNWFRALKINR